MGAVYSKGTGCFWNAFREIDDIHDWSELEENVLKAWIRNYSPCNAAGIEYFNILLVGFTGAGKSSLRNTLKTSLSGRLSIYGDTGNDLRSFTKKVTYNHVRDDTSAANIIGRFRLVDTPGLVRGNPLNVDIIQGILDGRFPHNGEIPEDGSSSGLQDPVEANKIHCLVFVVSGSDIRLLDQMEDFIAYRTQCRRRDIPCVSVMTKVDKVCSVVDKNPRHVFHSVQVYNAILRICGDIDMEANRMFLVQNYTREGHQNVENKKNVLALFLLKSILRFAQEYLGGQIDTQLQIRSTGGQMNT